MAINSHTHNQHSILLHAHKHRQKRHYRAHMMENTSHSLLSFTPERHGIYGNLAAREKQLVLNGLTESPTYHTEVITSVSAWNPFCMRVTTAQPIRTDTIYISSHISLYNKAFPLKAQWKIACLFLKVEWPMTERVENKVRATSGGLALCQRGFY